MLVSPLPTAHQQFTAGRYDEAGDFPSPKNSAFGGTTSTLGGITYPNAHRDSLATALEKCFLLINLSEVNHPVGYAYAGGSVIVELDTSVSPPVPTGLKVQPTVGLATLYSVGEAYSLAAHLRAAGFGTAYVPPAP